MSSELYCLVRAEEEGILEAVQGAASIFDPFLRRSIRSNARRATEKATVLLGDKATALGEAHVLRVAFLVAAAKVEGLALDDAAAVQTKFSSLKLQFPLRKKAFWPVTTALLVVLVLGGVAGFAIVFRPTPEESFVSSPLGSALSESLTDYISALAKKDRAKSDSARTNLLSSRVKKQIGDDAFAQLTAVTDRAYDLANADDILAPDAEKALTAAISSLNDLLARKQLPACLTYYVKEEDYVHRVWVLGYYVPKRSEYGIGSLHIHTVLARRLDSLNLNENFEWYYDPALNLVVISLDDMGSWAISHIVPTLGKSGVFTLFDDSPSEFSAKGKLNAAFGAKLRSDLLPKLGLNDIDATFIADQLKARHDAYERLRQMEAKPPRESQGITLSAAARLGMQKRDNEIDAKEILAIDDRLDQTSYRRGFSHLAEMVAAVKERAYVRELAARAAPLKLDEQALHDLAGPDAPYLGSQDVSIVLGALSEVQDSVALTLAVLQLDHDTGAEKLALAALERELGIAVTWNVGFFDRDGFATSLTELLGKDDAAVRAAASRAHAKLLGAPPASLGGGSTL